MLEVTALGVPFAVTTDEDQRDRCLPGGLDGGSNLGIVDWPPVERGRRHMGEERIGH